MSEDYNFQKELKKSIFNADPKLDRGELLEDIFKVHVAKLFELVLGKKIKDRIEFGALVQIKRNLINEFRSTELGEYQRSVEWYEHKFDETIQQIFNEASLAHNGKDSVVHANKELSINKRAYVKEGGLFVPEHLRNKF